MTSAVRFTGQKKSSILPPYEYLLLNISTLNEKTHALVVERPVKMRVIESWDSMSAMQIRVSIVIVFFTLLSQTGFSQGRHTARSMVVTKYGIVATSHTLASQAGAEILRRGGSAVDAAIAANATLGVVEPMMNGIGGDLFAIYWDAKTGKLYGINSSGWAPQGLTIAHLKAKDASKMPLFGIDSVTVPGAVAGWNALYGKFGHLAWKEIFQPAIFYAQQGYPLSELVQSYWEDAPKSFAHDAEGQRVYL